MIIRKYRLPVEALCIAAMLWSSACSKQPDDCPLLLSDEEIAFRLSEWTPMEQSRADIYRDGNDLLNPGDGGGNFTLYAHVDGTDRTYIGGARVWYFEDPQVQSWIFLDGNESPIKYYWPNSDKLNFFAFMPDSRYDGKDGYKSKPTHVNIGAYSEAKGQTFSCSLPADTVRYDTEMQEFIYAYEEPRTKDTVRLHFKHPFATINFKVAGDSYRMTIKDIVFSKIFLTGEFSTAESAWTATGEARDYAIGIDKRIPNDVNYNTLFDKDSPFLVMPQKLDGVKLMLNASRDKDNDIKGSFDLSGTEWLPGKQYVYTIKVGDNNSEIYFNVEVAGDWIAGGENNIDVE